MEENKIKKSGSQIQHELQCDPGQKEQLARGHAQDTAAVTEGQRHRQKVRGLEAQAQSHAEGEAASCSKVILCCHSCGHTKVFFYFILRGIILSCSGVIELVSHTMCTARATSRGGVGASRAEKKILHHRACTAMLMLSMIDQ